MMNVFMQALFFLIGCLIYVKYNQCDPLRSGRISRADQVVNKNNKMNTDLYKMFFL